MKNKKIIGIGTDIVNVKRIETIFKKYGDKFLSKNFHELEIVDFKNLPEHKKLGYLAKRFAAKEAIAKALGCGIGENLAFVDIAVTTNEFGAPKVKIDYKKNLDISEYDIHVSLSDDQPFAVAFAVITS
ncbi:MAG: holo-ACP synthase [Rickettsiaceae bacterium]|nr:holo-ACP synthase [Rickettsiaceae bacterium]